MATSSAARPVCKHFQSYCPTLQIGLCAKRSASRAQRQLSIAPWVQVEDDDTAKDSLINTVEGLLADLVARGLADATVQLRPTFTASTPLELQTLLAKHCVSRPEAGKGEEMQGVFVIEAVEQSGIAMNDFLTTGSLTPMWVTLPEVVTQQLAGKVGWGIRAKAVQGDDYNEYNQSCDTWKLVEVHQVYPE